MTAKKHRWTRRPGKVFLLHCGDCDQTWRADRPAPTNECVPGPDKAVSA